VIDKTGLTGKYDFTLEFAGSAFPANSPEGISDNDSPPVPPFSSRLEKHLGLKLEQGSWPGCGWSIDHVDKVPTEN